MLVDQTETTRTLADVEREVIAKALRRHPRNIRATALALGIGRSTLYRKMAEYAL